MVKPRGKVKRGGFRPGMELFAEIEELDVAVWCPDERALEPPEQVHLIVTLKDMKEIPLVMRFKSPNTLGFLIEQLAHYRREVWPEAEPLDLELNELR